MNFLSLQPISALEQGWLESLQASPFSDYRFIASNVRGPNPGIYLFDRNGRSRLVSIRAKSPSGIGLNERGISTLVDMEGHRLRRWHHDGREISPIALDAHGVKFPNDARRDVRTGITVGGSIGASLDAVASRSGGIVDQPLWLVRPDGQVSLSKKVYTCLNGVAFGDPGTVYSVESFNGQRLVKFTYNNEGIVQSEKEVYSFISNPDGMSSFRVGDGRTFLAVAHPFTYEVSILALTGSEVKQILVITSSEVVGQPITPVVEVYGSKVIVTSVVTRPGTPNMFEGAESGLASIVLDAEQLQ